MKKEKRSFGKILMVLTLIFFYLPIVYMVIFSFNSGKSLTSFSGFSLRWYRHMMESHTMMESLYTTFSIALIATAISTVVGTISAIGLSKSKKIVQNLMEQVNNLPMMNPEIVTAIGFMLLFITFRVEKGYVTMLLAHIAFCIPYVMLSVMPKIRSLDPNLADAAMDLGATPWRALTKVIVPQIMPGIVTGIILALGRIVGESAALLFTAGSDYKLPKFTGAFGDNLAKLAHKAMESGGTLTIELYLQMQKGQYDNAFGIGCVLIVIVLILNLLTKLAANKLRRE